MSYYYKKYEWTAFAEADLLKNGDNNFSKGDSFTMGSPTVKMSTYDNDSTLSGGADWWCNTYSADQSGQDASIEDCRVGCKMYAERYHVLQGSDGKTYYLIEIAIEGHDAPGAGSNYLTFYGARPPAGTVLTSQGTCEVSGSWIDYSCLGAGTKVPPNTPPTFTNVPEAGMFCIDENTKLVIDLDAKDADCDTLAFSIVGGADGAAFQIDAKTGLLTFKAAPDYEAPTDADGNNVYKVIVAVSDGKGGVANKELSVCVKDVAETPECVVIEAEDMSLCGYNVKCASSASGNEYIALNASWWGSSSGYAQTKFAGVSGEYDLSMRYWDGSGDGLIKIFVNGTEVGSVRLNADTCSWKTLSLDGLDINKGDVITLKGYGSCSEGAIIDKIKLCPTEPEPQPGALEGRVFIDANKDGLDNSETGVAGVTVKLLTAAGVLVATTTTDANGGYAFTGLDAGDYKVVFPTSVGGRVLTSQNVGADDTIDSDANTATGTTGNYAVLAGQTTRDVDAGLVDPGTAKLGDFVFVDANKNGIQDAGEAGLAGVGVTLYAADGVTVLATATTDGTGHYLFSGLDAGSYVVGFAEAAGYDFTTANVGNDALDSDANAATGKTGAVALAIGETNLSVDAGLVAENNLPDPMDDAAKTCADEAKTVDVLANDSDPDSDALTITAVAGQAIAEGGSITTAAGTLVTLSGGMLIVDGEAAHAGLDIGEQAVENISYTVSDGNGGMASANLEMTFCGDANTVASFCDALPTTVTYKVADAFKGSSPYGEFGYDLQVVNGEADDRLDGVIFEQAYCLDFSKKAETAETLATAPEHSADMFCFNLDNAGSLLAGLNGVNGAAADNINEINWILNQDFENNSAGSVDGNFTGWEVQFAIWELTNGVNSDLTFGAAPEIGQVADVDHIIARAIAEGASFEAGVGDLIGVVIEPNPLTAQNAQPMLIALDFETYDCLC